jgi:hypothetical protein
MPRSIARWSCGILLLFRCAKRWFTSRSDNALCVLGCLRGRGGLYRPGFVCKAAVRDSWGSPRRWSFRQASLLRTRPHCWAPSAWPVRANGRKPMPKTSLVSVVDDDQYFREGSLYDNRSRGVWQTLRYSRRPLQERGKREQKLGAGTVIRGCPKSSSVILDDRAADP